MHETNRLAESYTILVLSFAIWSALSSFCGMREHFQNQKEIGEPENAAFSMIILSGGGLAIGSTGLPRISVTSSTSSLRSRDGTRNRDLPLESRLQGSRECPESSLHIFR